MEVRRTSGKPAEDWAFDLADVVKIPINQRLSKVCGRFAGIGRQTRSGILQAHGNLRQVAHIQSAEVHGWRGWTRVPGANI